MAHHPKTSSDDTRRGSTIQGLFKMFNLSANTTGAMAEDEVAPDVEEPPDDTVPELTVFPKTVAYSKTARASPVGRRESLLTRAIRSESKSDDGLPLSPSVMHASRGFSTASSHSAASMASTAELTSDGDQTSATRSATPSPPLPEQFQHFRISKHKVHPPTKITIAPITKDDRPETAVTGVDDVEKQLGHKRRIMFACGRSPPEKSNAPDTVKGRKESNDKTAITDVPKRRSMLTFACPARQQAEDTNDSKNLSLSLKARKGISTARRPSPAPQSKRRLSIESPNQARKSQPSSPLNTAKSAIRPRKESPTEAFHEFASSHDDVGAWVNQTHEDKPKLTLDDCMKKELAIRKIGREAEEEAEAEEENEEEVEELEEEEDQDEDDFAPSDESDRDSDGGNESDDEGGFAESDDESETGSQYGFWAPSTACAIPSHFSARLRSRSSTLESMSQSPSTPPLMSKRSTSKPTQARSIKLRPATPELPDSTDFVAGTLDEDRPLEAAYISCREQRKRERQVVIPQDIDPSFPTSDPEDNENDGQNSEETDDEYIESAMAESAPWTKAAFGRTDSDSRERQSPPPRRDSVQSKPACSRRAMNRSPPPKHVRVRSPPPPRRLFGQSPAPRRSPPFAQLRSPRGSPADIAGLPIGQAIHQLAQRPMAQRTSSLPRTPNPFFRNYRVGSSSISNIASGAVTPATEDSLTRADMHVRGPVDIKIGLEKKRQKRREKFWRQHCRKAAKDQALKKTIPGRGAERMKELGLECAERSKGYGLTQPTALVISL